MDDLIAPELRNLEKEIDTYYLLNPLSRLPFAAAAWNVMAYYEDCFLKASNDGIFSSIQNLKAFADTIIVDLQYPLRWFYSSCEHNGAVTLSYNDNNYNSAKKIAKLANNYKQFFSAYTLASRGHINLNLIGNSITPSGGFLSDSRYEAYNWLILAQPPPPQFSSGALLQLIDSHLKISGKSFHYNPNRLIDKALEVLAPFLEQLYELPDDWQFEHFSLAQFQAVSKVLMTIAWIHGTARKLAAIRGCEHDGFNGSIKIVPRERIMRLLARYSGIDHEPVSRLVDYLTFGGCGIKDPDPALQPLIPLSTDLYAIMPSLFLGNNIERNFITLLNRIDSEESKYSGFVNQKEGLLREKIKDEIKNRDWRYFNGRIPGRPTLPDIDLAIVCDRDRAVFLIELKWFIGPSEVREVIDRSEEIETGIAQLLRLNEALSCTPEQFHNVFGIDSSYKICFAVVSANFIGFDRVQDEAIPVIEAKHFITKANNLGNLRELIAWVENREYLPIEGKHYQVRVMPFSIGKWTLDWYTIEMLIPGQFDP